MAYALAILFFASWFVIVHLTNKGSGKTESENRLLEWLMRGFILVVLALIIYGLCRTFGLF